ncbi:UNVERIFIED_CONTAM: 30S ribosomal protein S9, chloroplastic [Sesamum radiatum]|uniref:30S ribosomal protein S9, chloroplastic n=1 Tax=Sesamum radiatum TaxID=300843 RepID=A0AAW2M3F9_SESRA
MAMAMANSVTALTSSLSSLSFSSQISHKPFQSLSFPSPKPLSLRSAAPKFPALVVAASSALADADVETADLKQLVKSRLPGGFAAQNIIGTGRRKCAIARVVLQEGSGKIIINYRDAKLQIPFGSIKSAVIFVAFKRQPYIQLNYFLDEPGGYDKRSGRDLDGLPSRESSMAAAQAISLGIARALLKVSDSHRSPLKQEGLLTRDARVVERKKPGLRKARKRPQYSKR